MIYLTRFLILLPVLAHAAHRFNFPRQEGDGCDAICAGLDAVQGDTINSTLCTNAIIQQYGECLDCILLSEGDTSDDAISTAQSELDSYIELCNDDGFPVQNSTVTAFAGAGASATSTPAPGAQSTTTTKPTTTTSAEKETSTSSEEASATDACVAPSASASDSAQTNGTASASASASGAPCSAAPSASNSNQTAGQAGQTGGAVVMAPGITTMLTLIASFLSAMVLVII